MSISLAGRLRNGINRHMLHPLGLHLSRAERAFEMEGLLARAARRDPGIATWIDVGASDGCWSLSAREHFPSSQFLLFEALEERQTALEQLHTKLGFHIAFCAAGSTRGEITFAVDAALDGSGVASDAYSGPTRSVQVERVDAVVSRLKLEGPYALKLDTHGYEIPVLTGAETILPHTRLLVIESYNFELAPGSPRFHELCAWLEDRGFRCCDLADPMRRPGDGALWQMDLAFAPVDSPLFNHTTYR